jgi:hypothetical protein
VAGHQTLETDGIASAYQADALNLEFDAEDLRFQAILARGINHFVDLNTCLPKGSYAEDKPSDFGHGEQACWLGAFCLKMNQEGICS